MNKKNTNTDIFKYDKKVVKTSISRLKYFRKELKTHPQKLTLQEWKDIIDKIIWSFEKYSKSKNPEKHQQKIQEGFELFEKYLKDF